MRTGEHQGQYVIVGAGKGEKFAHWLVDPWTEKVER